MLKKSLTLLVLLSLCACVGSNKSDQPNEIRIVDLNGNPKPIKKFVPEGNAKILASQNQDVDAEPITNNIATAPSQPSQNVEIANLDQPKTAPIAQPIAQNITEENIEYDMSSSSAQPEIKPANNVQTTAEPIKTNKKFKVAIGKISSSKTISSKQEEKSENGIFVQIGSFSIAANADKTLESSHNIFKGKISEIVSGENKSYRVLLGPISTSKKAKRVLAEARKNGYKDAFIVR